MKRTSSGWVYWLRLLLAAIFSLLAAFAVTIIWISYQQTMDYLHPPRQTASGALLQANGVEFQEVELTTQDNVKLSAWYTPPKNGAVILVAHGYGAASTEHYHASLPATDTVSSPGISAHGRVQAISLRLVMRSWMQKPPDFALAQRAWSTSAHGAARWAQ